MAHRPVPVIVYFVFQNFVVCRETDKYTDAGVPLHTQMHTGAFYRGIENFKKKPLHAEQKNGYGTVMMCATTNVRASAPVSIVRVRTSSSAVVVAALIAFLLVSVRRWVALLISVFTVPRPPGTMAAPIEFLVRPPRELYTLNCPSPPTHCPIFFRKN